MLKYAISYQTALVQAGVSCEVDLMERSLKKSLEQADLKNSRFTVIVGERDLESGLVSVRDMKSKKTEQVTIETLVEFLRKGLDKN